MTTDFEKIARVQEELEKQAVVGLVLKAGMGVAKRLGGMAVKHPVAALSTGATAAFNAMEVGSQAAGAAARAGNISRNISGVVGI